MQTTLFDLASRCFDGWTDPDTSKKVLRLLPKNFPGTTGPWSTFYHQHACFLDGGRTVILRGDGRSVAHPGRETYALNLTTGEATDLAPPGTRIAEVADKTRIVLLRGGPWEQDRVSLWDLNAGKELAALDVSPDWRTNAAVMLSDGRRALAFQVHGRPYQERVLSRHWLLTPGEPPRIVMEADGYFCSHMMSCPTDPNLYCYDRWPSPHRPIDQAFTMRAIDTGWEETVKLDATALRPGDMWGCRDHYVWTPDGNRLVSYLSPKSLTHETMSTQFNHFNFEWWLSVLDWRTGADLSAKYPPGRWGGHMQVTPDSRTIICGGGPGFDKLFAVDIESLRKGWNEHIICSYPENISTGSNSDPFVHPFVLPDSSGILFNAGWPWP